MRIGHRLFVTVLPAVLGLLIVVGMGQGTRPVPDGLLGMGMLAGVMSLGMAWHSARYFARRIDALSRAQAHAAVPDDEIDETNVIQGQIADYERWNPTCEHAAEALAREYAGLLEDVSATVGRRLDEVRLPLHILLSSRFGALNENQEEMIGAAHAAAENAGEALRIVGRIVDLDAGRVHCRPRSHRLRELLGPVLAALAPRLRQAGVMLEPDFEPVLPLLRSDPAQTREAFVLILDRIVDRMPPGARLRLTADAGAGFIHLRVEGSTLEPDESFPLARRLLRLQGGDVAVRADGTLEVRLPLEFAAHDESMRRGC